MKRLLFGGMSVLALSFPLAAQASATSTIATTATAPATAINRVIQQTPPVTLVNLAQQGYLREQGIPDSQALIQEIASGRITPEILVQAGIQSNLVTPETLNDREYLNIVEVQLRDLVQTFVSANVSN